MKRFIIYYLLIILLLASSAQAVLRTFTDIGDGLWSTAGNWDTGVPVNGDTFALAAGQTVEFDVDQSGFADGMGASTIAAGTSVVCSTTTGTYHMKMDGDLILAGTNCLQAGTDTSTTLPADVSFTIELNGAFSIEGNNAGQALLYCVEPTNKWIRLSGAEAADQTTLSIDTDLTADIWAVGDEIAIVDKIPASAVEDVERVTIDAIRTGSNEIDISGGAGAGGGLARDKVEGAYVCLLSRNIMISGSTTWAVDDCVDSGIYAFVDCATAYKSCNNLTIGGSVFGTLGQHVYACTTVSLDCVLIDDGLSSDDCVQATAEVTTTTDTLIGGYYNGLDISRNIVYDGIIVGCRFAADAIVNCAINGPIWGCQYGVQDAMDTFVSGNISVYYAGFRAGSGGVIVSNCEISGLYCLDGSGSMQLFNVLFTPATSEFLNYSNEVRSKRNYVESFDHDQVVNAFKAWCRGGIVTSQTAFPPTGFDIWYEHACEDTAIVYPCFRQFETVVQPGTAIEVEGYIRIADGENLTSDPPYLAIVDVFADVLVDSTETNLDKCEIPNPTGDATWQFVSVIWANSGDSPRTVIVRMYASVANVGFDVDVDEVWAIADYKDQINDIHTRIGTPANIDSGGATLAGNLMRLADDNDGADFNAARESLYALRNRGDLAWTTGVGSPAQNVYTIDTIVRTVGDADGGNSTMVDIVDGVTFDTGEVAATTKLEVDAVFTVADPMEDPAYVAIWGYYYGGGGHHVIVKAYNYIDSTFEEVGQIGIGSEVSFYSYPLNPQHIEAADGEISIKIVHSEHSGVTSHVLYIDKIIVATAEASALHANIDSILEDVTGLDGDVMRGTDSVSLVVPDAAGIAATAITTAHTTTDALVGGLNDFDPANDDVAVVTLVTTTTTNSDMRGTDGVSLVIPDAVGTAAGLHSTTDSLIGGLNNISVADLATALTDYDGPTDAEMLAAHVATNALINVLNNITANDVLNAVVEGPITLVKAMRGLISRNLGKASGGGTATIVFRDTQDTKDRVTQTVDVNGNRTSSILDLD